MSLADVLSPLMRAPRHKRPGEAGARLDVCPLAISEGKGLSIPVKLVGDLGFRNLHVLLVLVLPATVPEVVRQVLAHGIADDEAAGRRFVEAPDGGGYVAEFAVRLRPGIRKAVPLVSGGR